MEGGRIGKDAGFSELEYGILRERGLRSDEARIVITVHGHQVIPSFPVEKNDIPVDYVLTPSALH